MVIFMILVLFTGGEAFSQQASTTGAADSVPFQRIDQSCLRYYTIKNTGLGLAIGGAVVTGLGLALTIPAANQFHLFGGHPEWVDEQLAAGAIITFIGAAELITGIILATSGSSKLRRCQEGIKGVSFDLKYTPEVKGISLKYRF